METCGKTQIDVSRSISHSCINRIAGLGNRHLKL